MPYGNYFESKKEDFRFGGCHVTLLPSWHGANTNERAVHHLDVSISLLWLLEMSWRQEWYVYWHCLFAEGYVFSWTTRSFNGSCVPLLDALDVIHPSWTTACFLVEGLFAFKTETHMAGSHSLFSEKQRNSWHHFQSWRYDLFDASRTDMTMHLRFDVAPWLTIAHIRQPDRNLRWMGMFGGWSQKPELGLGNWQLVTHRGWTYAFSNLHYIGDWWFHMGISQHEV